MQSPHTHPTPPYPTPPPGITHPKCRISGPEYVAMIEAVTPKMISEFVRRLLASKPSLAAFGDAAETLSYEQLLARYGGGAGAAAAAGAGGGGMFSKLFGPQGGRGAALGGAR
jgi:hypothetical protein